MSEAFKSRKIGVSALCRVSAAGGAGTYLYIPKNFAEVYGLAGADYVEVLFSNIFTKKYDADEPKKKVIDLTSKKRKKKLQF